MPSEIASWPLAESTSTFGMKYGEMRSGPRSRSVSACSTIPIKPPIAEPKTIPTRCGSKPFRPESVSASLAAPSASTTLRSSRRSSLGCASPAGSKSLTSAATRTGSPSASNARIQSTPLSPATAARQVSGAVFPTGVTAPRPVTTTRLTVGAYVSEVPPKKLPFPPMEAELVQELPTGDWQYEPKWDGFRGVLENLGGGLRLWSRNGRPLLRYFPELEEVGALLPPESALDGEIIIAKKGRLEFDQLQLRLPPAESRIKRLSAEIPADYVAFDLLVWKGTPVWKQPLQKWGGALGKKAPEVALAPATRDPKQA